MGNFEKKMKFFALLPVVSLAESFHGFRVKFGEGCPKNSDFNIWGRCVCNKNSHFDKEQRLCLQNEDLSNWERVRGTFSGYPFSIEHNSYATKESALETCAKHEDCGGVTKINAGRFECRAKTFKPDSSSISWRKPENMKHQKYTKDDVNPLIIRAVDRLPIIFSSNFSFENRRFNAGQYSYSINSNFEPIQLPQVNLGSFSRMGNYEDNWVIYYQGGDSLFCSKARETIMFFRCGLQNRLVYVEELQPCNYKFMIELICT